MVNSMVIVGGGTRKGGEGGRGISGDGRRLYLRW